MNTNRHELRGESHFCANAKHTILVFPGRNNSIEQEVTEKTEAERRDPMWFCQPRAVHWMAMPISSLTIAVSLKNLCFSLFAPVPFFIDTARRRTTVLFLISVY